MTYSLQKWAWGGFRVIAALPALQRAPTHAWLERVCRVHGATMRCIAARKLGGPIVGAGRGGGVLRNAMAVRLCPYTRSLIRNEEEATGPCWHVVLAQRA